MAIQSTGHKAKETTGSAFQHIAEECFKQIVLNKNAARQGEADGIHQVRIGIRRLRTAICLFSEMLRDQRSRAVSRELAWAFHELGPARDLDVLAKAISKEHKDAHGELVNRACHERDAALSKVQAAIDSKRFLKLMSDIPYWLKHGSWSAKIANKARSLPVDVAAATALKRLHRKIIRQKKALSKLNTPSRHKLRLWVKKLRYACEFFGHAFPGKKAGRRQKDFVHQLKRLQISLGAWHDASTRQAWAKAEFLHGHKRTLPPAIVFAAGELFAQSEASAANIIRKSEHALHKFSKANPFW